MASDSKVVAVLTDGGVQIVIGAIGAITVVVGSIVGYHYVDRQAATRQLEVEAVKQQQHNEAAVRLAATGRSNSEIREVLAIKMEPELSPVERRAKAITTLRRAAGGESEFARMLKALDDQNDK